MELNQIYRQGDGSSIIPLAHEIKEGRLPKDFTKNQKDRSYFRSDAYQIEPLISKIVEKAKNKGFRAQDIQVLAPMYRGPAGIDALNKMMQEIFNPGNLEKGSTLERHRLSDRRQSPPISQYSRIECIQWRYGRNHGYHLGKRF